VGHAGSRADLVVTRARFPGAAEAMGVAVAGERILAVGPDAEIAALAGPRTRFVDAAGRVLLPGFNDAHVHFMGGGFGLAGVQLREARDEGEFVEALRRYAERLRPGEWITGGRWDHEAWPGGRRPNRSLIDPVTPANPVLVRRLDGHITLANSLALRIAGITRETPDPPGGVIERDLATGEPTGILVDAAVWPAGQHVPEPTADGRRRALLAATQHAAGLGVTSVQTMGSPAELEACDALRREGLLKTRVYCALNGEAAEVARLLAEAEVRPDDWLRTGAVKLFADGSLGARSALLSDPYCDDPATCGLQMHSQEELQRLVAEADAAGLQVVLHAIGDRAVSMALDAFAAGGQSRSSLRHRVEHAQVVRPEDRHRFTELGVVASLQPSHCTDDMRWIEKRLGERTALAYPYASLARAGARIALGTDWPVEPLDPMLGLHAAVTREFPGGGPPGGWHREERVCLAEAVRAYTEGSAYAEHEEADKGGLRPGMLADFVVLSQDLLEAKPADILGTRIDITFVGGRCVHDRNA
jgi:predicted amidohydrolase YtcJ